VERGICPIATLYSSRDLCSVSKIVTLSDRLL